MDATHNRRSSLLYESLNTGITAAATTLSQETTLTRCNRSPRFLRRKGHPLGRQRARDRPLPQRRQCTEPALTTVHAKGEHEARQLVAMESALAHLQAQKHSPRVLHCTDAGGHRGTAEQGCKSWRPRPWYPRLPRLEPTWTEKTNASATWRKHRGALKKNSQKDEAKQPKPRPRFRNWRKSWLRNFQVRSHRWKLISACRRRSLRLQSNRKSRKWNEENTCENDSLNLTIWSQQSQRESKTIRDDGRQN